jgi:hypothetical protein
MLVMALVLAITLPIVLIKQRSQGEHGLHGDTNRLLIVILLGNYLNYSSGVPCDGTGYGYYKCLLFSSNKGLKVSMHYMVIQIDYL